MDARRIFPLDGRLDGYRPQIRKLIQAMQYAHKVVAPSMIATAGPSEVDELKKEEKFRCKVPWEEFCCLQFTPVSLLCS